MDQHITSVVISSQKLYFQLSVQDNSKVMNLSFGNILCGEGLIKGRRNSIFENNPYYLRDGATVAEW